VISDERNGIDETFSDGGMIEQQSTFFYINLSDAASGGPIPDGFIYRDDDTFQ